MPEPTVLRPGWFALDSILDDAGGRPLAFPGYTCGERWNGWACPRFTHDQAQGIVEAWRTRGWPAGYDRGRDEFMLGGGPGLPPEEPEHFGGIEMNGQKLYLIGTFSWIWDEVAGDESAENPLPRQPTDG